MQTIFEKIIEKLEEEKMSYFLTIANTGDEKLDCAYEQVGDALDKAIEIVKQEAEQYEECYKDCGDCEAYNKEKHHCPKFCKVIKETVKEIEENHNGWIPCSEKLPEVRQDVLVTVKYTGFMGMHGYWIQTGHMDAENDWWGNCAGGEVIAWQPLPEPYAKGE